MKKLALELLIDLVVYISLGGVVLLQLKAFWNVFFGEADEAAVLPIGSSEMTLRFPRNS